MWWISANYTKTPLKKVIVLKTALYGISYYILSRGWAWDIAKLWGPT